MILTHKTECFPNKDQIQLIERCFGMRRFFFNKIIMTLKHKYGDLKENKKLIKKKEVMEYRKDLFRSGPYKSLTNSVPSHILETTVEDVMFSLNSLWKKGKEIKLRRKKESNTCRWHNSTVKGSFNTFKEKHIQIPKLGQLKLAESLKFDLESNKDIKTVTIKKFAGRYWISISCEIKNTFFKEKTHKHAGIDWGLKTYLTIFDGKQDYEFDFNNRKLLKLEKRIIKNQKSLSRKVYNSKNYFKAKTKLQVSQLRLNNFRKSYIDLWVYYLNEMYDSVIIENIRKNSNKNLQKSLKRKSFYLFKVALLNKFNQYNKNIYQVDKTFPSTQMCSNCGNILKGDNKLTLKDRIYECKYCGFKLERDINAAINIYSCKELTKVTLD